MLFSFVEEMQLMLPAIFSYMIEKELEFPEPQAFWFKVSKVRGLMGSFEVSCIYWRCM
jgi:hypothetical protein